MYMTDIKVNDGRKSAILNFIAIWHGFPDITHINVNNGCKSAILNLIEVTILGHIAP